jgi:hypothetical protein
MRLRRSDRAGKFWLSVQRCCYLALIAAALSMPARGAAQRGGGQRNRVALGIGIGRFIPLNDLATATGRSEVYKLDDSGLTVAAIDYWFTPAIATRISYQWLTSDLATPDQPSFARIRSGYLGVVLAPVAISQFTRPYLVLGGGFRYMDVNSFVVDPITEDAWDIAPTQYRLGGYAGLGTNIRIRRAELVPEAGVFINEFRHNFPCNGCSGQKSTVMDLLLSINFQLR